MTRIPYKWIVASVFVCAAFMDIMDTTIVNVALPTLAREFNASTASIEWVVLGYLLSLAIWIPASGYIGDRIGTKKVFLFALATFTIASALCGQAHEPRRARRVPGAAGCRRRDARPGRHRDVVPRVPADRAGAGLDHPDHPDRPRAGPRPDHRRLARHRRVVAVDLLREPAGRDLRVRRRVLVPQGAPRAEGAGASTSPGSSSRARRSRSCSTRSRRRPRRGGRRR